MSRCGSSADTGAQHTDMFLVFSFLFFIGSVIGWVIEVIFRRFFSSANPERKWINPGFCTGPYLPLYGFGLCSLYLIAGLEEKELIADPVLNKVLLFLVMAVVMTAVEYISGLLSIRVAKVRLWDYSGQWGNIQGIICPKFSLAWGVLGALYYFLIHPHIIDALDWLSRNLAFSFVIGMFYGVFIIDVVNSANLVVKLRRFAEENDVIVRFEALKQEIRRKRELAKRKYFFFRPFHSDIPLIEHLRNMKASFEGKNRRNRRE